MKELLKEKKNILFLMLPLGIAMLLLAKSSSEAAEHFFALGIYKAYTMVMSYSFGLIPFSIAELLVIAVPLALAAYLVISLIAIALKKGRQEGRGIRLARLFRNLLLFASILFFWFMLGCGTNYYRYEFSRYSGYNVEKYTKEELYELCLKLANEVNAARADTGTYEDTVFVSTLSDREKAKEAREAMTRLGKEYPVLSGHYALPKSVFFSRVMSEFNITGVYFPFTAESNINVDVPDYSITSTMCHELVHTRGFMREDEANYLAYRACRLSDCAELRYSGSMLALIHAGNRLYAEDVQLYRELLSKYSGGVILDLVANSEYWDAFEDTVLSEAGEKMNDTYLKLNNQTDGTKSYGRMVDLMLAEMKAEREN